MARQDKLHRWDISNRHMFMLSHRLHTNTRPHPYVPVDSYTLPDSLRTIMVYFSGCLRRVIVAPLACLRTVGAAEGGPGDG